jgi:radial spoke head protein 9
MKFQQFPPLNDQHDDEYNKLANLPFSGQYQKIHKVVENPEEQEALRQKREERANREKDPLESTTEEDPENLIVKINLKEIDRLHYHVRAIENDCHIVPKGSMKLNHKHEVQRNEAFLGLSKEENFSISNYSHFRNV